MTDWTAPRTWNVGELVTKTIMDTHVRDNEKYLKEHVDALEVREMLVILNTDTALVSGDGWMEFPVPSVLDGYELTSIRMYRGTGSGTPQIQLYNDSTSHDMLTSLVSPGTPGVINATYAAVSAYDMLRVDVDDDGTSEKYCSLLLIFEAP